MLSRLSLILLVPVLLLTATGCPAPTVTVDVSPSIATLNAGGTQRFTATVKGTSNTEVDWKVKEANGGSISSSGEYTAPATAGTFTVIATSRIAPAVSGSATITVKGGEAISVTVSPGTATVGLGGFQTFTASVSGSENTAVNWSVTEAGGGTITAAGLYTAPNTAGTFTVVATSAADSSKSASAKVTVTTAQIVSIAISPTTVTVGKGSTYPFVAMVSGTANTAVTWSVVETTGGSIDASGLYTAPGAAGTFHVRATSAADTTKQATATVTVSDTQVVNVSVTPASASLTVGGTQQFAAAVTGTANTAVTWTVDPASGGGTVSASGLYTAPATAGSYKVIATSVADPARSATALVTVNPAGAVAVSLTPTSATVSPGATQQFTATVTGSANTNVTWSVTGGNANGTVSATGLYTAPANSGSYSVVATSVADPSKSATATVTVNAPITVTVSPAGLTVPTGTTQQFTAAVSGTANQNVTWTIVEGAAGGTISASGLYTAGPTQSTYTIKATSVADPTRSGTVAVTVGPPAVTVTVTPATVSLASGTTQQFTATVTNTGNTAVNWSVVEVGGGTITASGLYSAPATGATYHVRATSVADPTRFGTATVTVTPQNGPFISGVINYTGTRTGRIYITLVDANDTPVAGTSIAAPGPFLIHGMLTGNYTVTAQMDTLGNGMTLAALDPSGSVAGVATNSSSAVVNLVDPAAPAPANAMSVSAHPSAGAALLSWVGLYDATGLEVVDHYRITWARSSAPGTVLGTRTVAANGYNLTVIRPLTDGDSILFTITGLLNGVGLGSVTSTATTIGALPSSASTGTLTGSISYSGVAAPGPLYVVAFGGTSAAPVRAFTRIPSPGASQAYSLAGLPAGAYSVYGLYDSLDDGVVAPNDQFFGGVQATVTAGGSIAAPQITTTLATDSHKVTTIRSAGSGGGADVFSLSFSVGAGTKLPVKATLGTGPNVTASIDLPFSNSNYGEHYAQFRIAATPVVGQSYPLTITYSDGTTSNTTAVIAGVYKSLPAITAPAVAATNVSKTPTFTWTAPIGATTDAYLVRLYFYDGANFSYLWQESTTATTLPFPATQTALIGSGTYVWVVYALDSAGDYAVSQGYFTTAP